jgi:hypothetical protein
MTPTDPISYPGRKLAVPTGGGQMTPTDPRHHTPEFAATVRAELEARRTHARAVIDRLEEVAATFGRAEFLFKRSIFESTRAMLGQVAVDLLLDAVEGRRRTGTDATECDLAEATIRMIAGGATLTQFVECSDPRDFIAGKRSADR